MASVTTCGEKENIDSLKSLKKRFSGDREAIFYWL